MVVAARLTQWFRANQIYGGSASVDIQVLVLALRGYHDRDGASGVSLRFPSRAENLAH